MTTSAAFDRGASRYDLLVGLNPGYHQELRRAASALVERVGRRPGLRFIDLACGTGASTKALVGAAPGAEVPGSTSTGCSTGRKNVWPRATFDHATPDELTSTGSAAARTTESHLLLSATSPHRRDAAISEVRALAGGWLVVWSTRSPRPAHGWSGTRQGDHHPVASCSPQPRPVRVPVARRPVRLGQPVRDRPWPRLHRRCTAQRQLARGVLHVRGRRNCDDDDLPTEPTSGTTRGPWCRSVANRHVAVIGGGIVIAARSSPSG